MGLYNKLMGVPVDRLVLRELPTVPPSTTVRETVALMRSKRVGCVAVTDPDGRAKGRFTEHNLVTLLVKTPEALDQPVGDHMTGPWPSVRRCDTIAHLIDCMETNKLRFVQVVDDDGLPSALAGQKGVVEFLAEQFPMVVKVQGMSSKMHLDQREGA